MTGNDTKLMVGTFNVRGMANCTHEVEALLKKYGVSVLSITET